MLLLTDIKDVCFQRAPAHHSHHLSASTSSFLLHIYYKVQLFGLMIYVLSEERLRAAAAELMRHSLSRSLLTQQNNETQLTFYLINVGIGQWQSERMALPWFGTGAEARSTEPSRTTTIFTSSERPP